MSARTILVTVAVASVLAASCASAPPAPNPPPAPTTPGDAAAPTASATTTPMPTESADQAFEHLASRFLAEYLRRDPVSATALGNHTYDDRWPDPSAEGDADAHRFYEATRAELAKIPLDALSEKNRVDARILDDRLRYRLFQLDELRDAEQDPMAWVGLVGDGLDPLVSREFAPLAARMKSLAARLAGVPAIVAIAEKRLGRAAELEVTTAIDQNAGLVALCRSFEKPKADDPIAALPAADRAALAASAKKAADALEGFGAFLSTKLLPPAKAAAAKGDDFRRLGPDLFRKKVGFELQDDVDPDALAKEARALLVKTQAEMFDTAKELWPTVMKGKPMPLAKDEAERKKVVREVLAKLGDDRPSNATIMPEATKLLADATAFVKDHDLVRVPDEPCRVIEMPEYRRGVAVAYCDSSGPLEKKQETFFAIAPTPKDWPTKRADSFYREYNRGMLADLTVHEAMPGHYLQAMHANRFHSDVRAVFSSGPFVEGWAVYGEWLMAKHGFGGAKVRMQRQKMVLRLAANAILDHDIHAGSMDEKQALALMKDEAFQEEGEAVGKWKRARLTSGQLSTYFYGFSEMMKLREAAEKQPGFTERAYHDRLLSYGAPAMRYLRELMASPPAPAPTASH